MGFEIWNILADSLKKQWGLPRRNGDKKTHEEKNKNKLENPFTSFYFRWNIISDCFAVWYYVWIFCKQIDRE